MAIPKKAKGYKFKPQPGSTHTEILELLGLCIHLMTQNSHLASYPNKEIEALPPRLKRHFITAEM